MKIVKPNSNSDLDTNFSECVDEKDCMSVSISTDDSSWVESSDDNSIEDKKMWNEHKDLKTLIVDYMQKNELETEAMSSQLCCMTFDNDDFLDGLLLKHCL